MPREPRPGEYGYKERTRGAGRHGDIITTKRAASSSRLPEGYLQSLAAGQTREEYLEQRLSESPFKGVTLDPTDIHGVTKAQRATPQERKREEGRRFLEKEAELETVAGALKQSGLGMPAVYSRAGIIKAAADTMFASSEQEGEWNLDNWWAWLEAGRQTGSHSMDDEEIEDKFLLDPPAYNAIWDWIRDYEETTGITLEPNYTINLRGGVQRGPITGSRRRPEDVGKVRPAPTPDTIRKETESGHSVRVPYRDPSGREFQDRDVHIRLGKGKYKKNR